jgi:hypothetical protein
MALVANRDERSVNDLDLRLPKDGVEGVPVDSDLVDLATQAWHAYDKGRHPAALNFADCPSYALAKRSRLPLLFKGDDFSRTAVSKARNVRQALPTSRRATAAVRDSAGRPRSPSQLPSDGRPLDRDSDRGARQGASSGSADGRSDGLDRLSQKLAWRHKLQYGYVSRRSDRWMAAIESS